MPKRFEKTKHLFCESLEIEYEDIIDEEPKIVQKVVAPSNNKQQNKKVKFWQINVLSDLHRIEHWTYKGWKYTYISNDGNKGYAITTSKAYKQGNREIYWFAV